MERQHIYDIWRILSQPRSEAEAEIRALCRSAYLGDHEALCRVLGRYKMYVDTRDVSISSHLMLEGYWEMWVTAAMMQCVRRGSVVADVGANLGYFTMLLADLTGPEGRVLSFEPNPVMARLVRRSISVNGFAPFTSFHEVALGAHDGTAAMEIDVIHPGGGRVASVATEAESAQQGYLAEDLAPLPDTARGSQVRLTRFDRIPDAHRLEFIKMDVEGFEPQVWAGMGAILDRAHPLTIFMEFTVGRLSDPSGFLAEVMSHGFSLEIISFDSGIVPITREALLDGPPDVDHMLVFRRA